MLLMLSPTTLTFFNLVISQPFMLKTSVERIVSLA